MMQGDDDSQMPFVSEPRLETDGEGPEAVPEIEGYEIIGRLGHGGMGTVWRALQLSTRREVALKLLPSGALASERARLRFEREVELSAGLEHPNIARVYDSGLRHGLYYYAMECVRGVRLDDYVTQSRLSHRQILDLMRRVCRAVQHAHERGIIHRDLKPSNILVTADDRPHVLDFGLAKALESDTPGPSTSVDGEVSGTPAYMSPEQAAGKLDRLDTRTDVYSLGVILFRLLLGQSPYDLSGTRYEIIRHIAEEDVRRPRSISRRIDRELEALLLKALAHKPEERYASAGELARDIDNYLSGEPLIARAHTTIYFLLKRIHKHRAAVVVMCVVLTTLLGMAVFTYERVSRARARALAARDEAVVAKNRESGQRQRAEAARRLAEKAGVRAEAALRDARTQRDLAGMEADKSRLVVSFLQEMFATVTPEQAQGHTVTMKQTLDWAAASVGERFAGQPEVEARLRHIIGVIYYSLGRYEEAQDQLKASLIVREDILGREDPNTVATMSDLAATLLQTEREEEAVRLYRKVLGLQKDVLSSGQPEILATMNALGGALVETGRFEEAISTWWEVFSLSKRNPGEEHPITLQAMHSIARISRWARNYDRAETMGRKALTIKRRTLGEEHPSTLGTMTELGYTLCLRGKRKEGEDLLRHTLATQERILGPAHRMTGVTRAWLVDVLTRWERRYEAEVFLRRELEVQLEERGEEHRDTVVAMVALASFLSADSKRYHEADRLFLRALESQRRTEGARQPHMSDTLQSMAVCLQFKQGRFAEAEGVLRQTLALRTHDLGPDHVKTFETRSFLGACLEKQGKAREAERIYRETLEAVPERLVPWCPSVLRAKGGLANILLQSGRSEEAETLAWETWGTLRDQKGDEHIETQEAAIRLLHILSIQDKQAGVERLARQELDSTREALGANHPHVKEVARYLAEALEKQEACQQ